jgi:two-component system, OmpR family, alkaline phosphatase synthesis response regulator PhoP
LTRGLEFFGSGAARCPRRNAITASVLIADDDPNILQALSFLMRREGYDVRTARDGEAALAAVAERPPDLVLLDLMMPKGDGLEVCRAIRAAANLDGVRVVMLTARGREADQRRGLALGADAYIAKPFAVADVVDCVAEVLGRPASVAARVGRS